MIPGVGGHVEPWATQAFLTTGSSLSSTSPMLESRPVGHGFKRIRSLGIYVQSTDFNVSNFFFFFQKTMGMKSPQ